MNAETGERPAEVVTRQNILLAGAVAAVTIAHARGAEWTCYIHHRVECKRQRLAGCNICVSPEGCRLISACKPCLCCMHVFLCGTGQQGDAQQDVPPVS